MADFPISLAFNKTSELIQIYSNDFTQNFSQFTHNKFHCNSNTKRPGKVMSEQNSLTSSL